MDDQEKDEVSELETWQRSRELAAVEVVCRTVYFIAQRRRRHENILNRCVRERESIRKRFQNELIFRLITRGRCRNLTGMGLEAFKKLYRILKYKGGLLRTRGVSVKAQLANFLYILSHNVPFHHPNETASPHFQSVLRAIISLEDKYLQQPTGAHISPSITSNNMLNPIFKDCVGVVGGSLVRVKVSSEDAARYSGSEGFPTIKVLAACRFDLKFTYVLPGWEGSVPISRIIESALTREDRLHIPDGKYYLIDAGYVHNNGLISPFKDTPYGSKAYSIRPPENARELFNYHHKSLHSSIHKAFGILEKQFPILRRTTETSYSADVLSEIVIACCILHNFLMEEDLDRRAISEVDKEIENQFITEDHEIRHLRNENEDTSLVKYIRNSIACDLWNSYQSNEWRPDA